LNFAKRVVKGEEEKVFSLSALYCGERRERKRKNFPQPSNWAQKGCERHFLIASKMASKIMQWVVSTIYFFPTDSQKREQIG